MGFHPIFVALDDGPHGEQAMRDFDQFFGTLLLASAIQFPCKASGGLSLRPASAEAPRRRGTESDDQNRKSDPSSFGQPYPVTPSWDKYNNFPLNKSIV